MSSAAREDLHTLVDELPEEKLSRMRRVLEEEVRANEPAKDEDPSAVDTAEGTAGCLDGLEEKRARRLAALERIERSWQGQPATTADRVDEWIRQSRH